MSLDAAWLVAFMALFLRSSAMLVTAPITAGLVPVPVRILFGAVLALSLSPVVGPMPVPADLSDLLLMAGREIVGGLLIGGCLQMVVSAFSMAGGFIDLQIGISSAQLFQPEFGEVGAPVQRLKHTLALVLLFASQSHHLMIEAFVRSYELPGLSLASDAPIMAAVGLLGQMMLVAVQLAAPVAVAGLIIDLAAGLINKAVPQTQPFLLALPAKLAAGILALALALPGVTFAMRFAVEAGFDTFFRMMEGAPSG